MLSVVSGDGSVNRPHSFYLTTAHQEQDKQSIVYDTIAHKMRFYFYLGVLLMYKLFALICLTLWEV